MIKKGLTSLAVFFLYLISLLPFWVMFLIADFMYVIIFYMVGYRRKVVQQNLLNAFPEKTDAERKIIEKKFFHHLTDIIVETIKYISISRKEVARRMVVPNPELLEHYFNQNRSIIVAVGHYCNWEMGVMRGSTVTDKRTIIIYKPLNNKTSDNLYRRLRERFGATLIPMKSTLRRMAELKNELTLSVFAADQTPTREEAQYFTQFLNQPTAVYLGIEKIAKMFNSVVVFGDIRRLKRGYYQCTFVPLVEEPKQTADHEITEAHVHYLEGMIREEPQYWLWSHRRWKFKPEELN